VQNVQPRNVEKAFTKLRVDTGSPESEQNAKKEKAQAKTQFPKEPDERPTQNHHRSW